MELTPKQKSDVQFNGEKINLDLLKFHAINANKEFQERYNKIVETYNELFEEVFWNNTIYGSVIRFQPVIGEIYYLYNSNEKYFISIISPSEWKKNCIGKFKYEYNGKWTKLND